MNKVLVTGANSLLATNTIIELLNKGYKVKGLLRNIQSYKGPEHQNLELIEGSFTNQSLITDITTNCSYLIHVAAITAQNITKYKPYKYVNVEATMRLAKIAQQNNIKKFVFVSSANAYAYGTKNEPGDETKKIKPPFCNSYYAYSKFEAQQELKSLQGNMEVVTVNPTFMIGPFDARPSSGKIIFMGYQKNIIFIPPGGKNFIHVKDAAIGVVKAMEKGTNREAYILANENLTYKQFFRKLSEVTNNRPIYIKLPKPVLLTIGLFGNIIRKLGILSNLSYTNMRILCTHNYYTAQKAKEKFNIEFQPIKSAIKSAIEWFQSNQMLKK